MDDFRTKLIALVEAEIAAQAKAEDILLPLTDALGRVIVASAWRALPHQRRGALHGLVEIVRNDLDGAVVRHDQIRIG